MSEFYQNIKTRKLVTIVHIFPATDHIMKEALYNVQYWPSAYKSYFTESEFNKAFIKVE